MKKKLGLGFLALTFGCFLAMVYQFREIPITDVFPGLPWADVVPQLPKVKGIGSVSAENCGRCHTEIYFEWKTSTHSQALSDLQFQSELAKESSPKWLCLNCHIPVQNQRESIIKTLYNGDVHRPVETANPDFDPKLQKEAVTCATCHVKLDESGESYILGGTGGTNPPHPVQIDKERLNNRCNDCHNQTYTLNSTLICYFQTGDEMKAAEAVHPNKNCASCHLPSINRSFVKPELDKPIRKSHRHGFVGGGVPKRFDLFPYQIPNGYQPGLVLASISKKNDKIWIELKNENAGHSVPSADPERFLRLEMEWLNEKDESFQKESFKIGQDWEWHPVAKQKSDNRIKAGEKFQWELTIPKNSNPKSVRFRVIHVRLKNEVSDYMSKNSERVPLEYQEKVKDMKANYPHSAVILESSLDLKSGKRIDKPLELLFRENQFRRGE